MIITDLLRPLQYIDATCTFSQFHDLGSQITTNYAASCVGLVDFRSRYGRAMNVESTLSELKADRDRWEASVCVSNPWHSSSPSDECCCPQAHFRFHESALGSTEEGREQSILSARTCVPDLMGWRRGSLSESADGFVSSIQTIFADFVSSARRRWDDYIPQGGRNREISHVSGSEVA
jgi:hypothetical protein